MYKIESNIPIPPNAGNRGRKKYPFDEMKKGDSIFFEGQTRFGKGRNAAYAWARKNNVEISVKQVEGGMRMWRLS